MMKDECIIFHMEMILRNNLAYYDPNPIGSPTVLLLHGLGADGSSWTLQMPPLIQAGMRPVAPDLPGFGSSPAVGGWSIRKASVAAVNLMEELGEQQFAVVGISMGGVFAQQVALDYPQRVTRLMLVNTFATLRPRRWSEWKYLLRRAWIVTVRGKDYQAEMVAQRLFPKPGQEELRAMLKERIRQADPRVYSAAVRGLGLFDSRRQLKRLKMPTLVVSGAEDTTVPLENQAELARQIPGAQRVVVPEAGHAIIVDQPERFNQLMIDFLLPEVVSRVPQA
jgi:3-oxoadipate enol-lactonase